MKKFLLFLLVYSQLAVFANYNDIYILDIKYDWINKSMVEKEAIISEIKDIIFDNIDVLIDGKYDKNQRDITLKLRGSKNQRVLRKNIDF